MKEDVSPGEYTRKLLARYRANYKEHMDRQERNKNLEEIENKRNNRSPFKVAIDNITYNVEPGDGLKRYHLIIASTCSVTEKNPFGFMHFSFEGMDIMQLLTVGAKIDKPHSCIILDGKLIQWGALNTTQIQELAEKLEPFNFNLFS